MSISLLYIAPFTYYNNVAGLQGQWQFALSTDPANFTSIDSPNGGLFTYVTGTGTASAVSLWPFAWPQQASLTTHVILRLVNFGASRAAWLFVDWVAPSDVSALNWNWISGPGNLTFEQPQSNENVGLHYEYHAINGPYRWEARTPTSGTDGDSYTIFYNYYGTHSSYSRRCFLSRGDALTCVFSRGYCGFGVLAVEWRKV